MQAFGLPPGVGQTSPVQRDALAGGDAVLQHDEGVPHPIPIGIEQVFRFPADGRHTSETALRRQLKGAVVVGREADFVVDAICYAAIVVPVERRGLFSPGVPAAARHCHRAAKCGKGDE